MSQIAKNTKKVKNFKGPESKGSKTFDLRILALFIKFLAKDDVWINQEKIWWVFEKNRLAYKFLLDNNQSYLFIIKAF